MLMIGLRAVSAVTQLRGDPTDLVIPGFDKQVDRIASLVATRNDGRPGELILSRFEFDLDLLWFESSPDRFCQCIDIGGYVMPGAIISCRKACAMAAEANKHAHIVDVASASVLDVADIYERIRIGESGVVIWR